MTGGPSLRSWDWTHRVLQVWGLRAPLSLPHWGFPVVKSSTWVFGVPGANRWTQYQTAAKNLRDMTFLVRTGRSIETVLFLNAIRSQGRSTPIYGFRSWFWHSPGGPVNLGSAVDSLKPVLFLWNVNSLFFLVYGVGWESSKIIETEKPQWRLETPSSLQSPHGSCVLGERFMNYLTESSLFLDFLKKSLFIYLLEKEWGWE